MKTVNEKTDAVKQEEHRYKARLSYYTNVLKLAPAEAEKRAKGGGNPTSPGELSPWKQRQLAKKKGQPQPLKLNACPKCGLAFFAARAGSHPKPIGLDTCPAEGCGVRYYFCE
jgi:hypothetical protein